MSVFSTAVLVSVLLDLPWVGAARYRTYRGGCRGFFLGWEVKPNRLLVAAYGCIKHLLVALDAQPFPVRESVIIPGGE